MTDQSGPSPEETPGLQSGGGVEPGDTPPDAGQTSGLSHPQPMPGRAGPVITVIAVAFIVLAIACFFVARIFAFF